MAIPFIPDEATIRNSTNRITQLLRTERLLKEVLFLLRWATATGRPIPHRYLQHFQRYTDQLDLQQRRLRLPQHAPEQRLRNDLPDLVTSTGPVAPQPEADGHAIAPEFQEAIAAARSAAPHFSAAEIGAAAGARARGPAAGSAADALGLAAAQPRTVTLQVEMCPDCYYHGNGRKLKVIGVTRVEKTTVDRGAARAEHGHGHGASGMHEDDDEASELVQQIRVACRNARQPLPDRPQHDEDHQPADQTPDGYGSMVAKHIVSLLNPSTIETSLLTAVFVVVGWKIFIKQ